MQDQKKTRNLNPKVMHGRSKKSMMHKNCKWNVM
jgi:hypothetical protein